MREIKFRVYDVKRKEYVAMNSFDILYKNGKIFLVYFYGTLFNIDGFDFILEQYTGLKDKNGVEIYEGDILDIGQTVNGVSQFIVFIDELGINAKYNSKEKRIYEYNLRELLEIDINKISYGEKENEVVGNIHENKEMQLNEK